MPPRKKKPAGGSLGLEAPEVAEGKPPAEVEAVEARVVADGGAVLARYREPLGSHWLVLASLPLTKVEPTPYQRELSEPHVKRLAEVMPKVGRFLDPVVTVMHDTGWWTPNGRHRLAALRLRGARAIVALIVPELEIAMRILSLNTEKARVPEGIRGRSVVRARRRGRMNATAGRRSVPVASKTDGSRRTWRVG